MKRLGILKCFASLALMACLAIPQISIIDTAKAATPNIGIATPGVFFVPIQLSGQVTADKTAAVKITLPFEAKVIGATATARASGGTTPTLAIDILDDGVTILSAPIAVTAGAVAEGTVSAPVIADESVVTVNLDLGGTSPTWDDITITLTLARR